MANTAYAEPELNEETKHIPNYGVIIFNDDDHSFEYVIIGLIKVFRITPQKAADHAKTIHEKGQSMVWTGSKEVGELKIDQIKSLGVDLTASKPVKYPLITDLVPLR